MYLERIVLSSHLHVWVDHCVTSANWMSRNSKLQISTIFSSLDLPEASVRYVTCVRHPCHWPGCGWATSTSWRQLGSRVSYHISWVSGERDSRSESAFARQIALPNHVTFAKPGPQLCMTKAHIHILSKNVLPVTFVKWSTCCITLVMVIKKFKYNTTDSRQNNQFSNSKIRTGLRLCYPH